PAGTLGLSAGTNQSACATVTVGRSLASGYGILALTADFDPGTTLSTTPVGAYGAALQLNTATFATPLNLSTVVATTAGNGPIFLGAAQNATIPGVSVRSPRGPAISIGCAPTHQSTTH